MELVPTPGLPLVVVPIVAGSGSEVSHTASFIELHSQTKLDIKEKSVAALFVVVDPVLLTACPTSVATDTTPILAAVNHVLTTINAETVVHLKPTSPVRTSGLIDRCIRQFQDTQADSLTTDFVCKYLEYASSNNLRRQDCAGFFFDDGNVYVFSAEMIRGGGQFGKTIDRVTIDREQNIEMDDWFDLWIALKVMERREEPSTRPLQPHPCFLAFLLRRLPAIHLSSHALIVVSH